MDVHDHVVWLCCIAGLLASAAGAQPTAEPAAPAETPDEITVTGQRSLSALDRDIGVATEKFWELLNVALDDPQPGIALKNRELERRMVEAINARPDLRSAIEELARLKQEYLNESTRRRAE